MAKNWAEAQSNEKEFWNNIYIKGDQNIYEKVNDDACIGFTNEVLKRHNLKIDLFKEKVIADIGCGPFGVIKGLLLISKKKKINISKIFGIDPMMNFFKENIKILKEDNNICLESI